MPYNNCETAMPYAQPVELPNGNTAIPQHYLQFEHTLESVQHIICDIDTTQFTPIFADTDAHGMYIQVGIIGEENYDRSHASQPKKIVYGRKWRIERNTPTSEIIQTAFLAVQKVWEHEVREFFTISDENNRTSALFSCHHDLPLMANNRELLSKTQPASQYTRQDLHDALTQVAFKHRTFYIDDITVRKKNTIVDIKLQPLSDLDSTTFGDIHTFEQFEASLVITDYDPGQFLYSLMDALVAYGNQMVEQQFTYKGFHRFSRGNDPRHIAALSIASRPYKKHMQDSSFANSFQQINYENDATRVPSIGQHRLEEKNRRLIENIEGLTGHLPHGC